MSAQGLTNAANAGRYRPAGLYRRSVAWSIDAALLAPVALLVSWRWTAPAASGWVGDVEALLDHGGQTLAAAVIGGAPITGWATSMLRDPQLAASIAAIQAASWALVWPGVLAFALLGALYHGASECLAWQGSPGKRLLGLRVHDRHGQPLGIGHALLRHVAGLLSWLTLNLGHALAALAPQHLALHDRCSGTRVVACAGPPPRWALAWLGLLALATAGTAIWLANRALQVMSAALEQALY